jgi:large subunit ribosomal protein L32
MPTPKQEKQMKREARQEKQRARGSLPDPRKEEHIIKHGDWKRR